MPSYPPIFISYRGDDRAYAARLRANLARRFGEENVFFNRDRDCIPPASDFPSLLDAAVQAAEILVAVVGPGWRSEASLKRLNTDPDDFVRRELLGALERRGRGGSVEVLPLTVGAATMSGLETVLPANLRPFAHLQAIPLHDDDPYYQVDLNALFQLIDIRCPGLRARRQNAWLRRLLDSEELSRARLGENIAVRQAESRFVGRHGACQVLDAWWDAWPQERSAFVLLGEEGDGKSWAVADWLADKVADQRFTVPVVFAPAIKLSQAGVAEVLADALQLSLPAGSGDWSKNLQALSDSSAGDVPLFLLVVDAFNERPSLPWHELFDTLRASPWRERVALIGLCRTRYWEGLDIPNDGLATPWTLPPFSDGELDEALAARGATRDQFSADLLHRMSRPRYFDLAFRLRNEVAAGGLTLERLIYEDWRDMIGRKRRRTCNHEEFLGLISGLTESHAGRRIPLDAFAAHAKAVTDSVTDLRSELTAAGILDGRTSGLVFSPRHLPLALGLVLANAVEEHHDSSPAALRELIARHQGGIAEADLQVRICAQALFHALVCRDYPEKGRMALLRAWIEGRNLDENDLHAIASHLPLQPATYLRMAEYIWGEAENREAQDAFMLGFLRHRCLPAVDAELKPTFARWLGLVYPAGFRANFERDEAKLADARREVEKRLGGPATPGSIKMLGVDLEVTENGGWLRLAQVALAVISHDRSHGWADALLRGLVAATVMEGSHGEFGWVLHTCGGAAAQRLLADADRFFDFGRAGHDTAYLVARKILMSLGSEAARQRLRQLPEAFRFVHPVARLQAENPCDSFGWRWTEDNYLDCLARGAHHGAFIARQLEALALNPAIRLPDHHRARLGEAGAGLDLANVRGSMGATREELDLDNMEPALCAFLPARYSELMSSLAAELADRAELPRQQLAHYLFDHLPALSPDARATVVAAWRKSVNSPDEAGKRAQMSLFPLVLFGQTAAEQVQTMLALGEDDQFALNRLPSLAPLDDESAQQVLDVLRSIDASGGSKILNLLWYLSCALPRSDEAIRNHLLARFDGFDTNARAWCLALVVNTQDQAAAERLIEAGWSSRGDGQGRRERGWGSLMLAELGGGLAFEELLRRIAPEWLFDAIERRGSRPEELAAYAEGLDAVCRRVAALAPSPAVDSLSPYVRIRVSSDGARHEDRLTASDEAEGLRFANFTWGGRAGAPSLEALRDLDGEVVKRLNSLADQIGELAERELSLGNPWFGSSFRHGGLPTLLSQPGVHWREWIEPILRGDQRARHLLARCRGFYEALCAALLACAADEGARLYEALNDQTSAHVVDARSGLRLLDLDVFAAPASPQVDAILRARLSEATSDANLFEFALLCAHGGREEWLRELAEDGLVSDDNFVQARAVTLLGFSARAADGERLREWSASQADSWHRDLAEAAIERHRRFEWAIHWFNGFLDRPDCVDAWAAFRLFLRCVDRRFWRWLDNRPLADAEPWKRDALRMNFASIESGCQSNEKEWKDKLFVQSVKPNEVWPWMGAYQ